MTRYHRMLPELNLSDVLAKCENIERILDTLGASERLCAEARRLTIAVSAELDLRLEELSREMELWQGQKGEGYWQLCVEAAELRVAAEAFRHRHNND